MNKHRFLILFVIASLTVPTLLAACSPKASEKERPIRIGALMDYTGPGAEIGQTELWGLKLKLDEVGYQIAGRKIELIDEDSGGDPTTSLDKVRKLVESDKVDVVIGPMESHAALGVAQYLKPLNVPLIAMWEHTSDLLPLGNVFMPVGPLIDAGYQLGIYAYDKLGYRTTTQIRMDVVFTEELMKGFNDGFQSRGGKVVQVQVTPFTLDFSPYFPMMKQADFVSPVFFNPQFVPFMRQYAASGLKMPLVWGMAETAVDPLLDGAGDLTVGLITQGHYTSNLDNDANKQFVAAYTKKYGQRPDAAAAEMYTSLSMFLAAVDATKGDTTGTKVISALKNVNLSLPAGYRGFEGGTYGVHDRYIMQAKKDSDGHIRWSVLESYRQKPRS